MTREPSVYRSITVRESTSETMRVPDDGAGISEVAAWVESTGNGETADEGPEGFRYRTVYRDGDGDPTGVGRWWWAQPGDWVSLIHGTNQDREFDMPDRSESWARWLNGHDHVSGPALHDEDGS